MSFYNKYRPSSFSDIKGKSAEILAKQIELEKTTHAYIFAGPPGTGKTTMARVAAIEMISNNDLNLKKLILENNHPDVYEINCAVNNGVDNIRDNIIQLARLAPTMGKYKIFILDEAHMLTTQAQTSLIKITEEPPSSVKFFFCTTDPQKILRAIQTRCQVFLMKKLSNIELLDILKDVCLNEKLTYDNSALQLIVNQSDGSAREALSILEQISILNNITEDNVRELLNIAPKNIAYNLAESIAKLDRTEACRIVQAANIEGRNISNLILETSRIYMMAFQYILFKVKKVDRVPEIEHLARTVKSMHLVEIAEQLYNLFCNIRQTVSEDIISMTGILKIIDYYAKYNCVEE